MLQDVRRGFGWGCGLILAFVVLVILLCVCAFIPWEWKSRPLEWGAEQLQGTERRNDWSRFGESGKLVEPRPVPNKGE